MPQKPNVLFFFTDDQRYNTIAALGNDAVSTPNIDALVRRGVAFTHAHIPCGTSGAVCMPSRAMLHSGRTLFHIAGAGQTIPDDHTTMGEAFRAAGYETFGTGKWHNGRAAYHRSFSHGDEIFFGGMADHWNVPAYHYDPSGAYDTECPIIDEPMKSNEVRIRACDHVSAGKHSSELVCDAAVRFLEERSGDAPFFAYVSFLAPHDPRSMPQQYLDMYDPDAIELPANFAGGHPFDNGALHIRDEMLASFPRTPEETRRHIAEYYAMISHLDAELGRVVRTLEKTGALENTIIVFAGDNGLALGQHGLFGKQSCYEHSVRVPLIFAGPRVPEGVTTDSYAYLLDIFPTLCDLLDVPIPESVEGCSLRPAFDDPSAPIRDELYFAYTDCQRAVKDDRYKLVEYVVDGRHTQTQLFDLRQDPLERSNRASTEPETVGRLRKRLLELKDEWDDEASPWGKTFWAGFGDSS